jgi:uncharacterized protein YceK
VTPRVENVRVTDTVVKSLAIVLLLAVCALAAGCGGGTAVEVDAPAGVEVQTASITSDGVFKCEFQTDESGEIKFDIPYSLTSSPENNPNVISGQATTSGTITVGMAVEAGEDYDIAEQLTSPFAANPDTTWGTVVVSVD